MYTFSFLLLLTHVHLLMLLGCTFMTVNFCVKFYLTCFVLICLHSYREMISMQIYIVKEKFCVVPSSVFDKLVGAMGEVRLWITSMNCHYFEHLCLVSLLLHGFGTYNFLPWIKREDVAGGECKCFISQTCT
jgi:hypothetical protein